MGASYFLSPSENTFDSQKKTRIERRATLLKKIQNIKKYSNQEKVNIVTNPPINA